MHYTYQTHRTCSTKIGFRIREGRVYDVEFTGGCSGNLQAIPRLIEGMDAQEVIGRIKGISCGGRPTSCGDQLAAALRAALDGTLAPD